MDQQLQLEDIYGFWHVPFWHKSFVYYGLIFFWIGCICAVICFCVIKYILKKRKISPAKKILHALYSLHQQVQKKPECGKEEYFVLIALLKEFFETHYLCLARSQTDEEFLHMLTTLPLAEEYRNDIKNIFIDSFSVRFAHEKDIQSNKLEADITRSIFIIEKNIDLRKS